MADPPGSNTSNSEDLDSNHRVPNSSYYTSKLLLQNLIVSGVQLFEPIPKIICGVDHIYEFSKRGASSGRGGYVINWSKFNGAIRYPDGVMLITIIVPDDRKITSGKTFEVFKTSKVS